MLSVNDGRGRDKDGRPPPERKLALVMERGVDERVAMGVRERTFCETDDPSGKLVNGRRTPATPVRA